MSSHSAGYYSGYEDEGYYSSPFVGGVGGSVYLRAYRLDTGFGYEASWDFIDYHGYEELRQVALMKYIRIDEKTRVYALAGGGLTTYDPGYSAQAGLGLDFSLTRRLSLHADLRLSYVSSLSESDTCNYQSWCGGGYYYRPTSAETTNAVLNVGGGWRFVSLLERLNNAVP